MRKNYNTPFLKLAFHLQSVKELENKNLIWFIGARGLCLGE
jgi:hypothetical protein